MALGTVLITGGHKGLGLEAVRLIASRGGSDIVLAGRDPAALEQTAAALRERFGANVRALDLDTSSLTSVRRGAAAFEAMVQRGDVGPLSALMLNAGMQAQNEVTFSADGFETTFATNCLGHFLLVNLLLDVMPRGGRVVWTASGTHDPDSFDGRLVGKPVAPDADALAMAGKRGKAPSGAVRYTTSKLCTMLYAYELHRRLERDGREIAAIAYDPGFVPETGLMRGAPAPARWLAKARAFKWVFKRLGGTLGDLAFSGAGLGRVAIDSVYATASGKFIQAHDGVLREARSSRASYDTEAAARLWRDCARLVGLSPEGRSS